MFKNRNEEHEIKLLSGKLWQSAFNRAFDKSEPTLGPQFRGNLEIDADAALHDVVHGAELRRAITTPQLEHLEITAFRQTTADRALGKPDAQAIDRG